MTAETETHKSIMMCMATKIERGGVANNCESLCNVAQ